jgi:hypothetical protein
MAKHHTSTNMAVLEHPVLRRQLAALLDALAGANAERRRAAVTCTWQPALAPVRGLVIERLADRLQRRRGNGWAHAAESLGEIGSEAAPTLCRRLLITRSTEFQIRLVAVLARIGQTLPPRERIDIQTALSFALAKTQDVKVGVAFLYALEQIKPG